MKMNLEVLVHGCGWWWDVFFRYLASDDCENDGSLVFKSQQ